eukprot:TRINITY_DN26157_c0_g1_i4.p1 TRINITY_DN26157_c0_g1~~TRINITY_DN26157_c0_g1_i4.p1  ORF type:complete len:113 (-),score=16.05 TRINITY_DN26157_c0_g1_i4:10-348(-)
MVVSALFVLFCVAVSAVTNPGCDSIRNVLAPVKNGTAPAGAKVVGLNDPNEIFTLNGGDRLANDLYIINNATVVLAEGNGDPITINGNIYVAEIGRAVQQECRDRSRMPSSA